MAKKCKVCKEKTRLWMTNLFDDRHGFPGFFDVYRCTGCGFAITKFKTNRKKNAQLYKKYYPRQKFDVSKINKKDYQIKNRLRLWRKGLLFNAQYWVKPKSKVLDVGCGLGFSLLELESIGCQAFGVDPDTNILKMAKKFNLNVSTKVMEEKPFAGEKFDYIITNQVLEHIDDPIKFLKICKNRITNQGKIILSFPNVDSLSRKLLKGNWLHWHIPYHLNHFNRKSIKLAVNKAGLKIDKIKTVSPNLWTGLQIRRLLFKPSEGERDYFWDGEKGPQKQKKKQRDSKFRKYFNLIEEYFFFNRLIDFFGQGESFLVILSLK